MARLTLLALSLGLAAGKDLYSCDYGYDLEVTVGDEKAACGAAIPYSAAHYIASPVISAGELPVDDDSFYVMAMVDPDAPSADDPSMAEVRHYLVGNINSTIMASGSFDANLVDELTPFKNPSPPEGSGYHRYTQLVYKQPAGKIAFEPLDNSVIIGWSVTDFAAQYGLGDPVASQMFTTEYECSEYNTQCGGGVNAEAPICCNQNPSYYPDAQCFKQNDYYYQCLETCPDEDNWDCNNK